MLKRAAHLLLLTISLFGAAASAQTKPTHWPTTDHVTLLPNFRFGTGETLPQLKLHYLTLGTPHRNAAGHTDNAVLLLHGTGGSASSLLSPVFSNILFGQAQLGRIDEVVG
jgi:homoserine O-acetyltransferase